MKISIPIFKGMRPAAAEHLLEIGEAQEAINIDIGAGDLRAMPSPLKVIALAGTAVKSIRRWTANATQYWLEFSGDVDVQKGPTVDDAYERIYFTGLNEPRFFANDKISDPFDQDADYVKLGVAAPAAALSASGYSTGSLYRAYLYTYVNRYGEEGPPSPLLEVSNYASGNVTLTGFSTEPTLRAIEKIRVYRTNASAVEYSEFQLVFATDLKIYFSTFVYNNGDLVTYNGSLFKCVQDNTTGVTPIGSAAQWDDWYDGIADGDLQPDTLVSEDWDPPPASLDGLCVLPNGSMAGFVGSTVYLGEPGYPHAWPQGNYSDDFRYYMPNPVVAIKPLGASLVVMTQGSTVLLYGSSPDQMSAANLPGIYPCLYKRSATETPMGVMYAARAGLVLASHDGLEVLSRDLLSERDWFAYTIAYMHCVYHDKKYIGFYNAQAGFQIDLEKKTFSLVGYYASATWAAEDDGLLYLSKEDKVDLTDPPETIPFAVMQWNGDDVESLYYNWKSGLMLVPAACNFGAARVTIDEEFLSNLNELSDENGDIAAYNAAIMSAGGVSGGVGSSGIGAYGIAGDALRSFNDVGAGGTVTFKLYCDRVLKFSKVVDSSAPFRLPAGFRSKRFEIAMEGYCPVRMVEIASGMDELYG